MFERFYTVENGRESTGLGLSIAKTLCERMGISIHAKKEKGMVYHRNGVAYIWVEKPGNNRV